MSDSVLSMYYSISINGVALSRDRMECVKSIKITEQSSGSDSCTLLISDPDFLFIEDNIFIDDAIIQITNGWESETYREEFKGNISAIDPDFPEDGFPTLSIYCIDSDSHRMNRVKKKRSWDKVTNADVIQKIAKEYGFKCVVESGYIFKVEDTISQSDATDIDFIESLAQNERETFLCKVKNGTIYYKKIGLLTTPVATLWYRQNSCDVISFSPKINKETKQESVSKSDISTNDKTTNSATASDSTTKRDTQGTAVKTSSSPTGKSYTYDPKTKTWK